jgi:hypothetical protein
MLSYLIRVPYSADGQKLAEEKIALHLMHRQKNLPCPLFIKTPIYYGQENNERSRPTLPRKREAWQD